jgi:hypothetical protein
MTDVDLQAAVRGKVESAEIHGEPFPHLVIPDFLPEAFFRRLEEAIPPLSTFSGEGVRANLQLERYFDRAPEEFRAVWGELRDELLRGSLGEVLIQRLENEIREHYAAVYSGEIADEIIAGGLEIPDGRLMLRKPGYTLKPHTDPARFAVTCLLYFTSAGDDSSGALCLFEPERTPEVRHTSAYYPQNEEGIAANLAKVIPISKNLFVAFVNSFRSLHGVRVERNEAAVPRLAFQAHILPKHDPRSASAEWLDRLHDPVARARWQAWADDEALKPAAQTD